MSAEVGTPGLRVLRGRPDDVELAAVVAVVAALASAPVADPPDRLPAVGGWADPRAGMRGPLAVGPGAWVASARIRGTRTRAAW